MRPAKVRGRRITSIPSDVYDVLLKILKGSHIGLKERDSACKKAYNYNYNHGSQLSVAIVQNPISSEKEVRIMYNVPSMTENTILLRSEEVNGCIEFFYKETKGNCFRKLKKRVDLLFTGITEKEIQQYINSSRVNQKLKCRFENKAPLHPIKSKGVWNRIQIDLMSMEDKAVEIGGKNYRWILSCIDVFSRYLVVRAMFTKSAAQIAEVLLQIFQTLARHRSFSATMGPN